ncbi:MAG: hypothetical protein QM767_30035 [Anaeromyxobacter sp.]
MAAETASWWGPGATAPGGMRTVICVSVQAVTVSACAPSSVTAPVPCVAPKPRPRRTRVLVAAPLSRT